MPEQVPSRETIGIILNKPFPMDEGLEMLAKGTGVDMQVIKAKFPNIEDCNQVIFANSPTLGKRVIDVVFRRAVGRAVEHSYSYDTSTGEAKLLPKDYGKDWQVGK